MGRVFKYSAAAAVSLCLSLSLGTAFAQCVPTAWGPMLPTPYGWRPCPIVAPAPPALPPAYPAPVALPYQRPFPVYYRLPNQPPVPAQTYYNGAPAPGRLIGIVRDRVTGELRGLFQDVATGALVEAGVPAPVAGWIAGRWNANLDSIGQERTAGDQTIKVITGISPAAIRKNGWCGGANSEARKWLGWTGAC